MVIITMYKKLVKFGGHVVFEMCERTDRQTNRHADRNTTNPYRWRSN